MPGRRSVLMCLLVAAVVAGCATGEVLAPQAIGAPKASAPVKLPAPAQDRSHRLVVPASVKIGLFIGGVGWLALGLYAASEMSQRTGKGVRECFASPLLVTERIWGHPAIYWMFGWMLLWGTVFVLLAVLP